MAIPQIKRGSVGGTDAKVGNNGYQSWRVFNPETSVDLVKPKTTAWNQDLKQRVTVAEPLVFHIAPAMTPTENGTCEFSEYRYGTGDRDFEPWALVFPMANSWGYKSIPVDGQEDARINDSLTWITSADMQEARNTMENAFYRRVISGYKSGKVVKGRDGESIDPRTEWPGLDPNISYMKQWLSNPARGNAFMRAGVLCDVENKVDDGNASPLGYNVGDIPQIVMLSTATSNKLFKALNVPAPGFNPMAREDYGNNFLLNDVTCICDTAKYAVVYMKGTSDYISVAYAPSAVIPKQEPAAEGFQSYDIEFLEKVHLPYNATRSRFEVGPEAIDNDAVRNTLKNTRPLYEYFDVPTDEQKAEYLAQAFAKVPSLLSYGMADNPEFFSYPAVRAILNNTAQVACAGNIQDDDEVPATPAAPAATTALSADFPDSLLAAAADTPKPVVKKKVVKRVVKRT